MRTQPYLARFPNRCERQRFQEKLNCDFYINVLMGSPYSSQIKGLANLVEGKISERGLKIKFDKKLFFAAAGMCIYGHRNQIRKSGRLYAEHPILVVERLIELLHVCDPNELIAGFLHDLVEDTQHDYRSSKNITVGDIEAIFGRDAARIVDGLTKLKQLGKNKWIDERNINKFVKALQQDVRVLRIKMVDRGCNLEDSEFTSRESRHRNATEALDLYVPLGVLAGFMKVARNLADVALKVLNLERYQEIQNYIARVASSSFSYEIARMKEAIEKRALKKNLDGPITVLSKSRTAYELAQIAELRGEDSWQPHDVLMIQVITQSEADCYRMLGVIQDLGEHPADKYWRDYIHDPKVNGYQSLHTAVWVNGILVRFQIRSREMQYIAQEGVLY
ncbi:MAG: HD domain-containing protein, partial [Candidatus Margulisbacteria bacterium]|nr:HD domain-containing protein [Candidatus Margulisiibacteriota bacterium]